MYEPFVIRAPFFEFGPKAYLYGEKMLKLAQAIDEAAIRYDVDVILTPQYTDIPVIAQNTRRVLVFAQHMDPLPVGRGLGAVLPEAVRAAGAVGVMLGHAEKPLDHKTLQETIRRADQVGLASIVCASTVEEVEAVARMGPNLIVAEPTELIGTGQASSAAYVRSTIESVRAVDPRIMVLQGAGITNAEDVYRVIRLGAMGTGCTSGIIQAEDPAAMAEQMLCALRRAWDENQKSEAS